MSGTVTESIFSGTSVIIPLADVQHIERWQNHSVPGIRVITSHTKWDCDASDWANSIWLSEPEATAFTQAWCRYRSELEADTIMDLSPDGGDLRKRLMQQFDDAIAAIKGEAALSLVRGGR